MTPYFSAAVTPHPTAFFPWSGLTLAVYFACRWVFLRTKLSVLHPGFTAILMMVVILDCTGHHYGDFKEATAWINWLLGPAVVAMAVPIFQLRRTVRANAAMLAWVIPSSLVFTVASTCGLLAALGRARPVIASGALKSITSPVAYRLAVDTRVPVDATLAGVLIAGILGATIGPSALRWMRVRDDRALGLALGCSAHGIGVARAVEISETAGAFASIAMSTTAMLGALVLPYVLRWILAFGPNPG